MKIWIYTEGEQRGPFNIDEINTLPIAPDTPVWHSGMANWEPAIRVLPAMPGFAGFGPKTPAEPDSDTPETQEIIEEVEGVTDEVESPADTQVEPEVTSWQQQVWQQQAAEAQRTTAQAAAQAPQRPAAPPTFIGWSIALMVCCCGSPFAIAALIGSIVTSIRYSQGNYEGARKASEVTEWLVMIAIALSVVCAPLWGMLF